MGESATENHRVLSVRTMPLSCDWNIRKNDLYAPYETAYRAFQHWLLDVPASCRALAGVCGKRHYLALEAMRHVEDFEDFLAQEATAAGMSFVLACWPMPVTDRVVNGCDCQSE